MRPRLPALVIVAASIAAGGMPPGGLAQSVESVTQPARRSACELLESYQVTEAIGAAVDEGTEWTVDADDTGWLSECVYQRNFEQVPLDVTLAWGAPYLSRFDAIAAGADASPVEGLADEAVIRLSTLWGMDQPVGALFAREGDMVIGLSLGIVDVTDEGVLVQVGGGARQTEVLVDLARMAIARLTGPPPEATTTCELLTLADAADMTGASLAGAVDIDEHDQWGPACHYQASDGTVALFLGVNTRPEATAWFDTCGATGEKVLGVGEEAFRGQGDCGLVKVGFYYIEHPLVARVGDTVVTVGQAPTIDPNRSREASIAIARRVFGQLGLDPGSLPTPVNEENLAHPCLLIGEDEVAALIGVPITSIFERPSTADYPVSECEYHAGDGRFVPLRLSLKTGPAALAEWATYQGYAAGAKTSVDGPGDEALTERFEPYAGSSDQPLVSLWVLSGDAVLELAMGTKADSADYMTQLAPGTPEEQLEMLRDLAELAVPRLRP